jgi:signal transduction histidine kinase
MIYDSSERKQAEEALQQRTHDLGERFKELTGLYSLSKIFDRPNISLEEALQLVVEVFPPAWHYPEITCARITLDDREYTTGNFKETVWRQTNDIVVNGEPAGAVEIFYLEEKPELDEGPFLKEERNLIDDITTRLGQIIEKKQFAAELDQHRHHLEQLVEERTVQLAEAQQQAEAANRSKSAFLANMSHEIRTPMNAIVGLTHLMRRAVPTPEQADKLDKIDGAVRHLLSIINDILDISKIEAGKLTLEQTDFHLDAIFDHILSMLNEAAGAKGVTIEVDPYAVPQWLRGDPTRLRQARSITSVTPSSSPNREPSRCAP